MDFTTEELELLENSLLDFISVNSTRIFGLKFQTELEAKHVQNLWAKESKVLYALALRFRGAQLT